MMEKHLLQENHLKILENQEKIILGMDSTSPQEKIIHGTDSINRQDLAMLKM